MSWQRRAKDLTVSDPGSTTDGYGNVIDGWTSPTNTTERGLIQQTQSTEISVGRDTVVSDLVVLLPVDSVVTAYSRIISGGITYEVVGVPAVYDTGSPGLRHTEAHLVTAAGG